MQLSTHFLQSSLLKQTLSMWNKINETTRRNIKKPKTYKRYCQVHCIQNWSSLSASARPSCKWTDEPGEIKEFSLHGSCCTRSWVQKSIWQQNRGTTRNNTKVEARYHSSDDGYLKSTNFCASSAEPRTTETYQTGDHWASREAQTIGQSVSVN